MPLLPGKQNIGRNISELHKGPRYRANVRKFGKAKANQIAVATAESVAHRGRQMSRKSNRMG